MKRYIVKDCKAELLPKTKEELVEEAWIKKSWFEAEAIQKKAIRELAEQAGLNNKIVKRKQNTRLISREQAADELLEEAGLKNPEDIFKAQGQVKFYLAEQPIYYDKNCLWWIWNHLEYKWEISDETDILNAIEKITGEDIITPKNKILIINSLKQECRKTKPKDIEPTCIQFKGTVYDIKTGNCFPATPDYFVTNPIPWKLSDESSTPVINRLLKEWVGEKYVKTLKEIVAYCTSSEQFLQIMIALTGAGSNGKGTFLKLITKFLGKENTCSSDLKVLASRNFETSALHKKLLCQMGEVSYDDLKNVNLLKKLTGEDLIRYEFKGKTPFSEYSPTTCIIATNSLPITPDKSIGFYRRWLIIDFPNQFPVQKDILGKIPDKEYECLARAIIDILKDLYKSNTFTNSGTFEERELRYEERSNPVMKFLGEYCEEKVGEMLPLREFTNICNNYLKSKHLRVMTATQIGKTLRDEGFIVGNRKIEILGIDVSAVVIVNLGVKNIKTIQTIHEVSRSHVRIPSKEVNSINSLNSYCFTPELTNEIINDRKTTLTTQKEVENEHK